MGEILDSWKRLNVVVYLKALRRAVGIDQHNSREKRQLNIKEMTNVQY